MVARVPAAVVARAPSPLLAQPRPARVAPPPPPAVVFRLLIFRPFVKEVLEGRVKSTDARLGVCLTLDFFEDVWIPPMLLRAGMSWRATDAGGQWFWQHADAEGEDGAGGEPVHMTLSRGDVVRRASLPSHFGRMGSRRRRQMGRRASRSSRKT